MNEVDKNMVFEERKKAKRRKNSSDSDDGKPNIREVGGSEDNITKSVLSPSDNDISVFLKDQSASVLTVPE